MGTALRRSPDGHWVAWGGGEVRVYWSERALARGLSQFVDHFEDREGLLSRGLAEHLHYRIEPGTLQFFSSAGHLDATGWFRDWLRANRVPAWVSKPDPLQSYRERQAEHAAWVTEYQDQLTADLTTYLANSL